MKEVSDGDVSTFYRLINMVTGTLLLYYCEHDKVDLKYHNTRKLCDV